MANPDTGGNATPTTSPAPAPSSGGTTANNRGAFARALLKKLGLPVTQSNVIALIAWMQGENTRAGFNPFATTQGGFSGATNFNSVGVKNYTSFAQGVEATAKTLLNGRYTNILGALRTGNNPAAVLQAVAASPWGTGRGGLNALNAVQSNLQQYASTALGTQASGGGGGGGYPSSLGPTGSTTALAGQLAGAGFSFPFDVSRYLDEALRVSPNDPMSYAYARILKSAEFRSHYPGIFKPDGTLRMSPAAYEAYITQATHAAANAGLKVTRQQIGGLIAQDVSPEEFSFRVDATAQIKSNKQLLESFNSVLSQAGYKTISSAQDAFNFLTGRANPAVYTLYEEAALTGAAKSAGLNINLHTAYAISERTPGAVTFQQAEESYRRIAGELKAAGPELQSFGITQAQLEVIEFGGPNRSALAAKAEQALRQREAQVSTPNVSPQVGLQGGRPVVASQQDIGF